MNSDKLYGFTTNGWSEIDNWFMNRFQFENGVSGIPDMTNYKMHIGLSGDYLPTSGGTVSGLTIISGSDFDHTLEIKRGGQNNNYAHIGLNSSRGLSFKAFDDNQSNNIQLDMFPNQSNNNLVQVQHNGTTVGSLIPAVVHQGSYTPTSDDGILHIVLES